MFNSNVTFAKTHNEEFHKVLRKRVGDYFKTKNISRHANAAMVFKTIAMLAFYLTPLCFLLTIEMSTWMVLLMWTIMGFGMAGVGLSVMHDANHGAYSKNEKVNKIIGSVIMILGGNDVNWKIQHNVLHHTYTNVTGLDEDISPPEALLRFSPNKKRNGLHRFQHIYAWFFYGLMTMFWFISKDYKQAMQFNKMGLVESQSISYRNHWITIIVGKIIFAFIFIVLPIWLCDAPWYISILGITIMLFISGLTLGAIFQPAHVVPTSNYPVPDDSGNIDADWAVSQLYNTANFAPKARLFSWYVGGLNFQVEHHLFPNICHVHYRKLANIVKQTAEEFNLPYHSYKTFGRALLEHSKMLYKLGHYDNAPAIH
jgi:linoleoyl-CoA desaturase